MSNSGADVSGVVSREALAGRLPVQGSNRLYNGFGSLLAACIAIGAASFNYLCLRSAFVSWLITWPRAW
jgi:hypothetical protein